MKKFIEALLLYSLKSLVYHKQIAVILKDKREKGQGGYGRAFKRLCSGF